MLKQRNSVIVSMFFFKMELLKKRLPVLRFFFLFLINVYMLKTGMLKTEKMLKDF
jgi:hypothetical protein